jgi:hypothetical protein
MVFLFRRKTGFKTYYGKTYHNVKFLEFLNKSKKSHLPQVTKRLVYDSFASFKAPDAAAGGRMG